MEVLLALFVAILYMQNILTFLCYILYCSSFSMGILGVSNPVIYTTWKKKW